jgi:hypothetical protein
LSTESAQKERRGEKPGGGDKTGEGEGVKPPVKKPDKPSLKRFHGSVNLDPVRAGRDAGKIAEEVIQHFAGIDGASVEVALEISVHVPDGVPENTVRTVTENCKTRAGSLQPTDLRRSEKGILRTSRAEGRASPAILRNIKFERQEMAAPVLSLSTMLLGSYNAMTATIAARIFSEN